MPAPIAKGLIISFSLLFAAGAALYENPQVRQWVDESRRKVAVALHSLGDEFAPQQSDEREQRRRDASTREDESAEAAERRRRARQEILERGRMMEERRRAATQEQQPPNKGKGKGMSFDDLVDKDGSLKREDTEPEAEAPIATTTAAEPHFHGQEAGLRHRGASTGESSKAAAALGATVANPFVDENFVDRFGSWEEARWAAEQDESRSPTPTLASPPVPPKPAAYQPQTLLIETDDVVSTHPSEQLVNLTPTTSASSAAADLAELDQGDRYRQPSPESYLSVDEWAQDQSVHQSFHPPPQTLADAFVYGNVNAAVTEEGSVADSIEHASQSGTEDMDVMSEFEDGINTPSTWTEVGSMASE